MTRRTAREWVRSSPVPVAPLPGLLAAIVLAGTAIRLVGLGGRVAHWDEARIAFWVLQYADTGTWTYHPVFHGPLLFHVERLVFSLLGPTDFAMRLPTALVGGALPASAWLFRDWVDEREVVAMAALLAANPLLVYYGRFLRNDILVAAFSLVALGAVLRASATGRLRYSALAGVAFGAALGSKENALLYLLAWVGAAVLTVGAQYYIGGTRPSIPARFEPRRLVAHGTVGLAALVPTLVLVYAPRGSGPGTFGSLASLFRDPTVLEPVLEASLVAPAVQAVSFWAMGSAQGEYPYYVFFGLLFALLVLGAAATGFLAVVGLRREGDRPFVRFAGLWAGLSILGYPAAADLMAGWIALHVVIPLSIPAAVGLASVWSGGPPVGEWLPSRRAVGTLVVAYLLLSVGLTSFVAPGSPYNPLGQPSQMGPGAGESIDAVEARIGGPGPDIAYVGSYWESHIHRLPLLWYVERAGGERQFVAAASELGPDPPPVVVTHSSRASSVESAVPAYECRSHERVPWEGGRPSGLPGKMLICVDPEAA